MVVTKGLSLSVDQSVSSSVFQSVRPQNREVIPLSHWRLLID
jgi:hypothetical protein